MLETGETLRTWAIPVLPNDWAKAGTRSGYAEISQSNTVAVQNIGDHRLAYLDYEGPVSGDRGSVRRLDMGVFTTRHESAERWEITVEGQFLHGEITLQQIAPKGTDWQLSYRQSPSARD
jgi:hypothetical protein